MRSSHTSADDWRAVADLLGDLALAESFEAFAVLLLAASVRLFRSDIAVFNTFNRAGIVLTYRMHPDIGAQMAPFLEPFKKFWHQHPWSNWHDFVRRDYTGLRSDWISWRRFRETGLWHEVYVHLRAKNQMGFGGLLSAKETWGMSVNRLAADFGPRDLELARYLRPRLCQLAAKAVRHTQAGNVADVLGSFFTNKTAAFALIGPDGCVSELSAPARDHFARMPGGVGEDQLPVACDELRVALRLRRAKNTAPSRLFTVMRLNEGTTAILLWLPMGGALVLVQPPEPLASGVRLTRRENEILGWLGEGKTNSEIGVLLGVSSRTVEKHCGNIFAKLGVENRLAAALLTHGSQ